MRARTWLYSVVLLFCAVPAASSGAGGAGPREGRAVAALSDWPQTARLTAARLIEKFGLPDHRGHKRLVWFDRGPWNRITLWNTASPGGRPAADELEETVACRVPSAKLKDLADFSNTIRVSQEGTLLSARSASEELNYLELNLSHDIIEGKLDSARARAAYARTVSLTAAGKESPLLQGLLFSPTEHRRSRWPVRFSLGHDPMLRDPLWHN